ncbi:MAG: dihydroneopterin aldolase [Sulfurimonas sp.]|nr:MAG: dihydroneopterin aldolase [Sulfurimonas sp.]
MIIHIEDLKFQCIIGLLDFERIKEQDVIINLLLEYEYNNSFINYVDIVDIVKNTIINNKFKLIEDALENLNLILTKEFKYIKNIKIKITKPSILPDCKVSVSNHYILKS